MLRVRLESVSVIELSIVCDTCLSPLVFRTFFLAPVLCVQGVGDAVFDNFQIYNRGAHSLTNIYRRIEDT